MSYLTFQGPFQSRVRIGHYPSPSASMADEEPRPGSGAGNRDGSAPESDAGPPGFEQPKTQPVVKRTRVLLSCAPCRISKLKCDRQQPCSQCLKKGRADACAYAPKPQKPVPAPRSMTARLKYAKHFVILSSPFSAEETCRADTFPGASRPWSAA
jgi:hypothetical protein